MASLEEYLLDSYETPENIDDIENQRFRIKDDNQADWALRKIARARQNLKKNDETAKVLIDRINCWLDSESDKDNREIQFFTALLQEYFEAQFVFNPHKKTYKLPAGQVQFRMQQPEFKRDDQALLAFLKDRKMTDYVETKEAPKWGELKRNISISGEHAVTPEGEIIDGVEVIHRPPMFKVVTEEVSTNGTE